jgi:single-strand DNA-binding protein
VEISGRVGVNAWVDSNGEAKASLTFNVNTIKLHGRPNRNEEVPLSAPTDAIHPTEEKENLPF